MFSDLLLFVKRKMKKFKNWLHTARKSVILIQNSKMPARFYAEKA